MNCLSPSNLNLFRIHVNRLAAELINADFKETLVRVEDFSNKRPMLFPIRGHLLTSLPDLSSIAFMKIPVISPDDKSDTVSKSLFIFKPFFFTGYANLRKIPLRTSMRWSISFRCTIKGGIKRSTFPAVQLISTPFSRHALTIVPPSCFSSIPTRRPLPRISTIMAGNSFFKCLKFFHKIITHPFALVQEEPVFKQCFDGSNCSSADKRIAAEG